VLVGPYQGKLNDHERGTQRKLQMKLWSEGEDLIRSINW
jgi:hypothetical protein